MRKFSRGFTLIEIIVALAVVSIAVLAMVKSMNTHTHVSGELEKSILANWVASNSLAELRHSAKMKNVRIGSSNESVKMGGHSWQARTRIEKTDVEKVYLVTIEVSDADDGDSRAISSMTTALMDPT